MADCRRVQATGGSEAQASLAGGPFLGAGRRRSGWQFNGTLPTGSVPGQFGAEPHDVTGAGDVGGVAGFLAVPHRVDVEFAVPPSDRHWLLGPSPVAGPLLD